VKTPPEDELRVLLEEKQALVTALVSVTRGVATAESALATAQARIAGMERDLELAQTWIKDVNERLWLAHYTADTPEPSANQCLVALQACAQYRQGNGS
jgi:hypothetical protein